MGQSAGAGSPVWFRCQKARDSLRSVKGEHVVTLTGRKRPYHAKRGSALGSRSTLIAREYECSCGYIGWSNHVDLAEMAGEGRYDRMGV